MSAFRLPTHIHFGAGVFDQLETLLRPYRAKRVLLALDQGLSLTPWPEKAETHIERAGASVMRFDEVEKNPRHDTIERLASKSREQSVDVVVGLGGGSVLDAAKAVSMLIRNEGTCADYEGRNRFSNPPVPFIAIPTTCGTGSEVTWVSVITRESERTKISVKGDLMFPNHAIVDPDTLKTLPAPLLASTGVDALTHALEAYTVCVSNGVSDALAEKSIALNFEHLPKAYRDPEGEELSRSEVMRASTLAGMAFGNADVGGVHCLSETIGGLYDAPHGLVNAMLLASVMRYHLPFIDQKLACLEGTRSEGSDRQRAESFLSRIEDLVQTLEIPPFSTLNIPREDWKLIARGAVANGSNSSNPQPMTEKNYLEILDSINAGKNAGKNAGN